MTRLKKLINMAALMLMVCWCLALLVPEESLCEHGTNTGVSGEHAADAHNMCSRRSSLSWSH
ncbi:hypothetical protein OKW34_002745 [Paraburkholderia youngii]